MSGKTSWKQWLTGSTRYPGGQRACGPEFVLLSTLLSMESRQGWRVKFLSIPHFYTFCPCSRTSWPGTAGVQPMSCLPFPASESFSSEEAFVQVLTHASTLCLTLPGGAQSWRNPEVTWRTSLHPCTHLGKVWSSSGGRRVSEGRDIERGVPMRPWDTFPPRGLGTPILLLSPALLLSTAPGTLVWSCVR